MTKKKGRIRQPVTKNYIPIKRKLLNYYRWKKRSLYLTVFKRIKEEIIAGELLTVEKKSALLSPFNCFQVRKPSHCSGQHFHAQRRNRK